MFAKLNGTFRNGKPDVVNPWDPRHGLPITLSPLSRCGAVVLGPHELFASVQLSGRIPRTRLVLTRQLKAR